METSTETPWEWRISREASSKASGFTSIPLTSIKKEGRKGTISTLSAFQTWLSLREEKNRWQVIQTRPHWTLSLEKLQKVSFMTVALRAADGAEFFEGALGLLLLFNVCKKVLIVISSFEEHAILKGWCQKKKCRFGSFFWVTSSSFYVFFILKCQMLNPAEPCVSLSWTYSSAQVWFLPFFSHSSTKNNNPMFKQVKTSGCTWANRINLWPYFSKQSTVQRWPTVANQWSMHQPPQSLQ